MHICISGRSCVRQCLIVHACVFTFKLTRASLTLVWFLCFTFFLNVPLNTIFWCFDESLYCIHRH